MESRSEPKLKSARVHFLNNPRIPHKLRDSYTVVFYDPTSIGSTARSDGVQLNDYTRAYIVEAIRNPVDGRVELLP
ncbi:MAG: hypothetical protein WC796_04875 [Candidatus Pacearchaeota archaeon]|jgi:hypothetical protein